MDKLSVIGKIGTILSDSQKQQEFFEGHPDTLNEVEVELFAASASYLAEYAKVLKKFTVNRIGKSLAPPPPAVQAVAQDDDDGIGSIGRAAWRESVGQDGENTGGAET